MNFNNVKANLEAHGFAVSTFPTAKLGIEKLLDGDFDAAMQICNSF